MRISNLPEVVGGDVLRSMGTIGNIFRNLFVGRGIEGIKRDAASGDPKAQFALGWSYAQGQSGLPQDSHESVKWYRRAAQQGYAGAQVYLGICLAEGRGVDQDLVEALKWIELARSAGEKHPVGAAANETADRLKKMMTNDQINKAREMIREFRPTIEKETR
jgi:TPR repeat protein